MTTKILTLWSVYLDTFGKLHLRIPDDEGFYPITSISIMRAKSWKIYSAPNKYVICILSDFVRYEGMPDFVIKDPGILTAFFLENGVTIS